MDLEYLNLYIKKIDKLIYLYFKTEKGKDKPRLMELIVNGEVKLYRVLNIYKNSNLNFTKKKSSNTRYFLEKNDNSNTVFRIPKKINIEMKEYFSDCNKLVKLIGLDGFRRKDIANIVLYYNEGCK
ncbi:MAG: hypothetical protein L3J14_02120 [Flavobacteriaceae bacterium]|nr:hypothetical protein [Flavobacteriaceae bacterium]